MRQKTIISLLLKNLKQAQQIIETFENSRDFNRYFKTLMFEFDDTIKKAEKHLEIETTV